MQINLDIMSDEKYSHGIFSMSLQMHSKSLYKFEANINTAIRENIFLTECIK